MSTSELSWHLSLQFVAFEIVAMSPSLSLPVDMKVFQCGDMLVRPDDPSGMLIQSVPGSNIISIEMVKQQIIDVDINRRTCR